MSMPLWLSLSVESVTVPNAELTPSSANSCTAVEFALSTLPLTTTVGPFAA
jgi:hypothetical protein